MKPSVISLFYTVRSKVALASKYMKVPKIKNNCIEMFFYEKIENTSFYLT